ncbi:MAG: hypothetical protein JWM28_3774 [Chitinophagaceae bacterium]|nr:hypothetical protein [Chitinophagaceae bacterium]
MKNKQQGFIVPLLITIIALFVIGGGIYVYENKKTETQPTSIQVNSSSTGSVDTTSQISAQQNISTVKSTPTVTKNVSNPINTSEWNPFKNEDYGFEFKYPNPNFAKISGNFEGDTSLGWSTTTLGYHITIEKYDDKGSIISFDIQHGVDYLLLGKMDNKVTERNINGHKAQESTSIYPVQTKFGPIEGYYKDVTVYIQKSSNDIANVNLRSPVFNTKAEAQNYDTSIFETFLTTIKFD